MEYVEIDKKNPPIEVVNLSLKDNQKAYLDPLPVMLKEYKNKSELKYTRSLFYGKMLIVHSFSLFCLFGHLHYKRFYEPLFFICVLHLLY